MYTSSVIYSAATAACTLPALLDDLTGLEGFDSLWEELDDDTRGGIVAGLEETLVTGLLREGYGMVGESLLS